MTRSEILKGINAIQTGGHSKIVAVNKILDFLYSIKLPRNMYNDTRSRAVVSHYYNFPPVLYYYHLHNFEAKDASIEMIVNGASGSWGEPVDVSPIDNSSTLSKRCLAVMADWNAHRPLEPRTYGGLQLVVAADDRKKRARKEIRISKTIKQPKK